MRELVGLLRPAGLLLLVMTLLTGAAYPAMVTVLAQALFPAQAGGGPVARQGTIVGSELIGQRFDQPQWFWGRPSATSPEPYNAAASGGSNLAPSNPALVQAVAERMADLRAADPRAGLPMPADLVTTSASGLDPHISPQAALYQIERVASARGLAVEKVRALVEEQVEGPQWGVLGQPRVNVLRLNLALEQMSRAEPGNR
jgi:K+-transporting ATPase ATPase C chain